MSTPATFDRNNKVTQTILVCIGIYVLFQALYYTKNFITPLLFATIFAILLDGVVVFVTRRLRFPRTLAIIVVLVLAMALALGIVLLIGYQGSTFLEDLPKLMERIGKVFTDTTHWVGTKTGVSDQKIDELYEQTKSNQMKKSSAVVGKTLNGLNNVIAMLFLMPIYIFMFLFYKYHFLEFLKNRLLKARNHIGEILTDIKTLVQFYLLGLLTELAIVSGLNSLGLFIIGVDYALLLGLISGVMNLIPYIGSLIAGALAAIVALTSDTPLDALWVVGSFTFVQFVDNTFIVPLIVGSRVKLNAFVSLVGVVAGGALWGVAGMILSIPLLGILKIIFDKTPPLEPWGYLLGDRDSPDDKPPGKIAKSVAGLRKKTTT
jgi:predicted PurR-regulated permease PerM